MKPIIVCLFIVLTISLSAQSDSTSKIPSMQFSGLAKTRYEYTVDDANGNFRVRNARLKINGGLYKNLEYQIQVELADLGRATTEKEADGSVSDISVNFPNMLFDAYIIYKPIKNLSITMGQFKIPFGVDNKRSPVTIDFTDRALLSGNITPAIRDRGVTLTYKYNPFSIEAAIVNGTGANKNENDKTVNYSLRSFYSPFEQATLSASVYGGKIDGSSVQVYDVAAHYTLDNLFLNAEYAHRITDFPINDVSGNAILLYGLYHIPVGWEALKSVTPAIRFESLDYNLDTGNDAINKFTFGLTFNFLEYSYGHFRINYEIYSYEVEQPSDDRVILEYQIRFAN